jgi:hypothetical protein
LHLFCKIRDITLHRASPQPILVQL